MSLRSNDVLEAFINRIITNKEIMDILKLPAILPTDTDELKNRKRKVLINKVITKSAQEPYELNKKFPEVLIDDVVYKDYGNIRLTVSLAQSISMVSDLFRNPQVEIDVYYDNTNMDNVFKLLDLISDLFSNVDLKVEIENQQQMIKNIVCETITSQIAVINNYERVGIRFSYYATVYKN